MIKGIALQTLRNAEFLQFLKLVLSIFSANDPAVLQVLEQFNALEAAKSNVELLFNKDQASAHTDEVAALDAKRDDLINGIIALVQGNTYHFDAAIKKQALALQTNIASYGSGIARENYLSETAILDKLINDWETKPELAAAIVALQLSEWKTQLASANAAFNAKYLERTKELGAASPEKLKEKRQEAANAYLELRDMLVSYANINKKKPPFGNAVNELNALIDQYNSLLASRKGGGNEPEPPTPAK
jgi:Family of unknown function (DUF6261)